MARCKFCGGAGCIACPGEAAKKEYQEPLFIIREEHQEEDFALVKDILSGPALTRQFEDGTSLVRGTPEKRIAFELILARLNQHEADENPEELAKIYRDAAVLVDSDG